MSIIVFGVKLTAADRQAITAAFGEKVAINVRTKRLPLAIQVRGGGKRQRRLLHKILSHHGQILIF